jgi:RecA/RadA recombinase|tara:strand:+ start:2234 stop:3382 length:1149 start_codon:yes stop_codon:yes gene_type:complete
MARTKKTETSKALTPNELISSFLKNNEKDHYNYEQEYDYKVSSGSLVVDYELGGGFGPGLHRFTGINEGGKTSEALEVMKNFLTTVPNGRGFYIKAEGRLSKEMQSRSGVDFVFNSDEWADGNCFVFECNIYETVVEALRMLVGKNTEGTKYCFILDSVDGLIAKGDMDKPFEDSKKVAGGAVIASDFMKRVSIALAKRGHMAIFISQVRADIKLDPYSKAPVRQTSATGGNALLHFANFILEFEPCFKTDQILQKPNEKYDPDKNKIIGRYAKITVKKSPNEKTNSIISYPIIYGRKGGKSIWVEKEILDMMFLWDLANKKGAGWIEFDEDFLSMLKEQSIDFPEKIQGENQLSKFLDENEDAKTFLLNYFRKMLSSSYGI